MSKCDFDMGVLPFCRNTSGRLLLDKGVWYFLGNTQINSTKIQTISTIRNHLSMVS